jgi:hypothetical protein
MKIRPVRNELFYADGRTDGRAGGMTNVTELIVAFQNFAKAPKRQSQIYYFF